MFNRSIQIRSITHMVILLVILLIISHGSFVGTEGVSMMETGYYMVTGKGKNKTITWVTETIFTAGEEIVVRAYVEDEQNNPLANATVDIQITGPETVNLTTGPSDTNGIAEATWQTKAPKKKSPGTTPGTYTATTTNVTADMYTWDGVMTSTTFTIQ